MLPPLQLGRQQRALEPLLELAAVDQPGQRVVAGLVDQPRGGLVDPFLHLVLHRLQVRSHVIDAALQPAQFGLPGLLHPVAEMPLADAADRAGQGQDRPGDLAPDAPREVEAYAKTRQQDRQTVQDGIALAADGGVARHLEPDPAQQPGMGARLSGAGLAERLIIVHHHLGAGDRRVVHQPVLVFGLLDAVGGRLILQRNRPRAQAGLRQPLAVVGKHRDAADVGLDRRLVEQGLQHIEVARRDAVFGRRCQLAGNRHGACAQRLVEIADFFGNELEQQQDADDGDRHQRQPDDPPAYPQ